MEAWQKDKICCSGSPSLRGAAILRLLQLFRYRPLALYAAQDKKLVKFYNIGPDYEYGRTVVGSENGQS